MSLIIVEEEEMRKEDKWQRKKFANGYMTKFDLQAKRENDNQHVVSRIERRKRAENQTKS